MYYTENDIYNLEEEEKTELVTMLQNNITFLMSTNNRLWQGQRKLDKIDHELYGLGLCGVDFSYIGGSYE